MISDYETRQVIVIDVLYKQHHDLYFIDQDGCQVHIW